MGRCGGPRDLDPLHRAPRWGPYWGGLVGHPTVYRAHGCLPIAVHWVCSMCRSEAWHGGTRRGCHTCSAPQLDQQTPSQEFLIPVPVTPLGVGPCGWCLGVEHVFGPSSRFFFFLGDLLALLLFWGTLQVLTRVRGIEDVDEEFTDLIEACRLSNMVKHPWRNLFARPYRWPLTELTP